MRNARLDEVQAGIKIAGRNINNLRYTDDTTLMSEIDEKLKIGRASWRERVETVSDFIFGGSKITSDGDCSHEIKRRLLLGRSYD